MVRIPSLCPFRRYLFGIRTSADAPIKDIHTFIGTFTINSPRGNSVDDVPMVQVPTVEPLSAENVLWSNTVLAAGSAVGFIVYTGSETRAVMNTSHPETKVGLLDLEINRLAKVGSNVLA
jgi:phospholipid-translocating ATPase